MASMHVFSHCLQRCYLLPFNKKALVYLANVFFLYIEIAAYGTIIVSCLSLFLFIYLYKSLASRMIIQKHKKVIIFMPFHFE
jgi:hypothetical protein